MNTEISCGAVVFTRRQGKIQYLLIKNLGGSYGFPKGHMEAGESESMTAEREIWEEVGLRVTFMSGFRTESEYMLPGKQIRKQVVYFLAEYENQSYRLQEAEIADGCLVSYAQAQKLLKYEDLRRILREADGFLMGK